MDYQFRENLIRESKSYVNNMPAINENTVDLSLGVNPFGCPKSVSEAFHKLDFSLISKYPHSDVLKRAVLHHWEKDADIKENEVFFSDGSVCGLYLISYLLSGTAKTDVVGFLPTFTDMVETARNFGMTYVPVPARIAENGRLSAEDIIPEITEKTAFIYLDRPNNPSGSTMTLADVEKILEAARRKGAFVAVDEAYGAFIPQNESSLVLHRSYDNLITIRSFSKAFGMANLRAGYLVADRALISILQKTITPYILSDYTRELCAAAMKEPDFPTSHSQDFEQAKKRIRGATGNRLVMLETDDRVPICTLHLRSGGDLQSEMMKNNLLTVPGADFEGLDESYVRLRVPEERQLDCVVDRIREIDEK